MSSSGGDSKKKAPASGGIHTLADLNRRSGSYDSGSDSDEHQDYYTGGEKSGMVVRDPSKGNSDVDAIFEKARQVSSTQEPIDDPPPRSSNRSFMGVGRLLSGGVATTPAPAPSRPESLAPVVHNITFWNDGFTVDEGPLRRFDDPQNASFLESIKKSECPKELEPSDRRISVHVSLQRKEENFPEPVKRLVPFQGTGRTLGSSDSQESSSGPPPSAAATSNASSSSAGLSVDPSIPSTSIQIRLADGTRMVARFNEHHTVADIRSFIDASRPGATTNYQLQTGFPPKQLTDLSHTIAEAGLSNSVLIQKP